MEETGTQRVQQLEYQVSKLKQHVVALTQQNKGLQHQLARATSSEGSSDRLAAEKADLENALEAEQEYIMHKLHKQLQALQRDKQTLMREKQQLKCVVKELSSSVERLSQEKVDLEASLEMEEEAFINSLMRQVAGVMQNYRVREQAMQRHGIKITQVAPGSVSPRPAGGGPRSGTSIETLSAASTPSHSLRQSLSSAPSGSRRRLDAGTSGSSPGANLHATRERLEALALCRQTSCEADRANRRGSVRQAAVVTRSEDSMSSLGSMMSAMSMSMSRDPSVTRESAAGASQPLSNALAGSTPEQQARRTWQR